MRAGSDSVSASSEKPGALGIGLEHDVEQAFGAVGRFLGEPPDAAARRDQDVALLGRELAGDDAEERGLAGAVASHESDPGTGRQGDCRAVEQNASANPIREVVDAEHDRAIAGQRRDRQAS